MKHFALIRTCLILGLILTGRLLTAGRLPAKSASYTVLVTATIAPETPLLTTLINIARIGAISPELETLNNETQATIFVGRKLYLPVITRAY